MGEIESFVALKPDQFGVERGGKRRRNGRLADTSFAFEQQGALEPEREVRDRGQAASGDIRLCFELRLQRVNRRDGRSHQCARSAAARIARRTYTGATPRRYSDDANRSPIRSPDRSEAT